MEIKEKMHVVLFDGARLSTSTLSHLFSHQCSPMSCRFRVNLSQSNNFSYKGKNFTSMTTENYNRKK